jgi:hypothetical protein
MANNDRNFGLIVNQGIKNPCRVATTVNLALLNGLLTVDGVVLVADDRVLVKNQTDTTANGIYIADTGDWPRAKDCDGSYDLVQGSLISVTAGASQSGFWQVSTADPIIVGTTALSFTSSGGGLGAVTAYAQTLLDDANEAAARDTLGLIAGDAGDIWIEKAGDTATGAITFNANVLVNDANFIIRASDDATTTVVNNVKNIPTATTRTRYHSDENSAVGVVAANELTLSFRDKANANFSADFPGIFKYRDITQSSGAYSLVESTGALSVLLTNGSTIGTSSGVPARLYFGIANDGGTNRVWIYNPWDSVNNILLPLDEGQLYSSTAEGGAGGADSAHVLYSTTAFAAKQIKIMGYMDITQATAGTWVSAPTKLQMLHRGDRRCGEIIQRTRFATGALIQGAVITPADDTVPQSTEGSSFMAIGLSPSSPQNLIRVNLLAQLACATTASMVMALHTTANSSAVVASKVGILAANEMRPYAMEHQQLAGSTNSQTFTFRVGATTTANVMLNGESTARILGGVANSFIEAEEVFA